MANYYGTFGYKHAGCQCASRLLAARLTIATDRYAGIGYDTCHASFITRSFSNPRISSAYIVPGVCTFRLEKSPTHSSFFPARIVRHSSADEMRAFWMAPPCFGRNICPNIYGNLGQNTHPDPSLALAYAQVSWIRHRDIHILTVGTYTYTTDQRFQTAYHRDINEWTLHIKWVQKRDAGMYECQISTIPIRSYSVRLHVIGKSGMLCSP